MLPIVLVLLVAANALGAPSINVDLVSINDVAPQRGGGGALANRAFEVQDNGANTVYGALLLEEIARLASLADKNSQSKSLTQTIATIGVLAPGVPGDACAAARVIDATVLGQGVRAAVANYIRSLISDIYNILKISKNSNSLKFAVGSRGNCIGGGRTFAFEAAWDLILSEARPNQKAILNDQYCAAKRLYTDNAVRDNNLSAAATAAALPSVNNVLIQITNLLQDFVGAINTVNIDAATRRLEQGLARLID